MPPRTAVTGFGKNCCTGSRLKRRIMMGGMFVGMLLLHLVIFILIVLLWIYRKPLAEAAARDKAMADRERKRNPSRKNRPYAWVVMLSSTAVLALDMYFDMPSVGVPGLIWKGLLAGPSLTVAVTSFMWVYWPVRRGSGSM
ncbi:MAG: hypothetical protein ACLUIQ_04405 [Dialister invisus]